MQLDAVNLLCSLTNQDAVKVAIVGCHLAECRNVASIHELLNTTGIIHGLVFQRRQAVVEHCIGHVEIGILQFGTTQLVFSHLDIVLLRALTMETLVESVTIVEHVISRYNEHQQYQQEDNGNALISLRSLQGATIVCQSVIGTHLLEELRIYLIIISIELPLVERQSSHCTLVADVEHYLVIGGQRVVIPLDFSRHHGLRAQRGHEQTSGRTLLQVMGIQIMATGIGKLERAGVSAINVGEISRIGINMSTIQRTLGVDSG